MQTNEVPINEAPIKIGDVGINIDEVNLVAIKERQCALFTAEDLKTSCPFFKNIVECVGVVISMKDGSKFCYHKFRSDSPKNFRKVLECSDIKAEHIEKIELYGGNINNICYPKSGREITIQGYDYKNGTLVCNGTNTTFTHNFNEKKPYNGYIFLVAGEQRDVKDVPVVDKIMSVKESLEYDKEVAEKLKTLNLKATFYDTESRNNYFFTIQEIEDFSGNRNRRAVSYVLKKLFNKVPITHQYVPMHSNLIVTKNGVTNPGQLTQGESFPNLPVFDRSLSSMDSQNSLYNDNLQEKSYKLQTVNCKPKWQYIKPYVTI